MSHPFNFFDQAALPAPDITTTQAEQLVREKFGIDGVASELGSQQDANFHILSSSGTFVLKVANPAFTADDLDAQDRAAAHVANCQPDILVPTSIVGIDGATIQSVVVKGQSTVARLVTYVDGDVLSVSHYLAPTIVASLGDLVGRTSRALASFDGAVPPRELQWDLRNAREVVDRLAEFVTVQGGGAAARVAASAATAALAPFVERLPTQPVHGDLTDDNVIATIDDDGRRRPVGVIDFGDLMESWSVAELAVTLSSLLPYGDGNPAIVIPAIRAFDRVRPLSDDELGALWPLVVLRAASLMVSGQHQASIDSANQYASKNLDWEWQIFAAATSTPLEVMTELVRTAVRTPSPRATAEGQAIVADLATSALDVSATSPALDDGAFLDPGAESRAAALALAGGVDVVYIPFLQARLTRAQLNAFNIPETVALGVELFVNDAIQVRAPWAGTLERQDDGLVLRAADRTLWLSGPVSDVAPGVVAAGDVIGLLNGENSPTSLRLQVCTLEARPPFFVPAPLADAWAHVSPDPTPLIDPGHTGARQEAGSRTLLSRRDSSFATVQEHYFGEPPQIERGWKQHLFDVDGRAYLDMLNNVSILGHGHPRLADAIGRQWRLLNTNSRFHYNAVVEFSERLCALLPEHLDTVFLVNSGSEADDLALRLAWANTGRREILTVQEAYHGWTDATDSISTSVADNPNALDTRPSWSHSVAAPNTFRGKYRGTEAHRYAEDAVAYVQEMVAAGTPPAAFLCEPYYGNAGGMALPDGYLAAVYEAVRQAGGLCIADEVQVGYGRLGEHFWGFEQQEVVPDVVTVAKAMGNGHPLGAVITTKEIAAGYRSQGYFFSSAGGSPVSSVAGLTVLDVLRDENLQENARFVGGHLRQRLLELADRHEIIGAVHGMGLYVGVEMVRDRVTLEPAPAETSAICDRMRELGVIMQPTSDRQCVLKIKPPLGIGIADADFFADTLDRVLTEGW
ncbi:MAG: aminotransferase [Aeromicrobium sp.]